MKKIKYFAIISLIVSTACTPAYLRQPLATNTAQASAPPAVPAVDEATLITDRVLQQINGLRGNIALAPVSLNTQLSAAASAHSRDMAAQNRAWHWGSDGSSPLDRARRQGYQGPLIGENISETYEDEIQTLSAWMSVRDTRDVIMDPKATQLGFAWFKEPSGKLWWTLLTGS